MLVISRKRHELTRIVVLPSAEPQIIDVVIAEIRGDKVRLGFEGDRQLVSISREEVYEAGRLPPGAIASASAADAELAGEGEVPPAE